MADLGQPIERYEITPLSEPVPTAVPPMPTSVPERELVPA